MTGNLPAAVFECATKEERKEMVTSKMDRLVHRLEDFEKKEEKKKVRSEYFNLKQGITLTLTSDVVDREFCDPNSDVSLSGYMNGEFGSLEFGSGDLTIYDTAVLECIYLFHVTVSD
jgi:hypothetical protein